MAGDGIAGILDAGIALHHRLGEIPHQGKHRHHRPQPCPHQGPPVPTQQHPAQSPHQAGTGHATQGPFHRFARGDW